MALTRLSIGPGRIRTPRGLHTSTNAFLPHQLSILSSSSSNLLPRPMHCFHVSCQYFQIILQARVFCRYASEYAKSLLHKLREDGIYMRPLGNVIYLMCGPCTSPHVCCHLLEKLYRRLEEFDQENSLKTCES